MCSSIMINTESDPLIPNDHLQAIISAAISGSGGYDRSEIDTRTELDSHANMCVFGEDCFVFEWSGKTCSINQFSSSLGQATDVPICDLAVAYEHISDSGHETLILIFRNALCIPEMDHNLIPPFIFRDAGHIVNECPKFQCSIPTANDHCIMINGNDIEARIQLQLHGTFSYFHTRLPTVDELYGCPKIFMSPDASEWNPYCESYENNERAMTTWRGDLAVHRNQPRQLMTSADEYGAIDISSYSYFHHSYH